MNDFNNLGCTTTDQQKFSRSPRTKTILIEVGRKGQSAAPDSDPFFSVVAHPPKANQNRYSRMPPKEDKKGGKSKQIQAAKSAAKGGSSGGKAKKKKWSKGKTKEKLVNLVLFDKATYDKVVKELPTTKVITTAVVSERFKINGSLARRAIKDLASKGLIKKIAHHHRQYIYTRATPAEK